MSAPDRVVTRGWQSSDLPAMESLLDPAPDPFWLIQRTGWHDTATRPDRFAITLVAEDSTGVVGAATLFESRYHPGRYPTLVEVAPHRRREGIGRRLLTALADKRPARRPMAGKLRDANEPAMRYAAALGMRTYQHCPVPSIDPSDDAMRTWTNRQALPASARIIALRDADQHQTVDAMVEHYRWVHERWSPMGDREPIHELWSAYVENADATLSSVAVVHDRVAAVSLIWIEDGRTDCVAETITRHQPDGIRLVAACVARSLTELDHVGTTLVTFDGHDDDPHLQPVINTMPHVQRDPISLVEFDP